MNFAAYFVPLSRTGSHQPQKRVSAFEGFYGLYSTMRGSTRPLTVRHCVVGKKASLNAHTKTVFGWGSTATTAPQIWCSPLQSAQKFNKSTIRQRSYKKVRIYIYYFYVMRPRGLVQWFNLYRHVLKIKTLN